MEISGASGFSSSRLDANLLRTNSFDLFNKPKYNADIVNIEEQYFYPNRPLSGDSQFSPVEIEVVGNGQQFLQMNKARLEIWLEYQVKENGKDWVPLNDRFDCTCVPLPASSIFKNVQVKINHINIPELQQDLFAYKAYTETLMESTEEMMQSYLYPKLGFFDEPGDYSDQKIWKDFGSIANTLEQGSKIPKMYDDAGKLIDYQKTQMNPIWLRRTRFLEYNPIYISTPLQVDFLSQDKLFPPNTSIELSYYLNDPKFYCLSPVDNSKFVPRIVIKRMRIAVPMVTLKDSLSNTIRTTWQKQPAMYYFQHVVPRTFHIPSGSLFWENHQISNGILPKSLYVAFVDTHNFNGLYDKSPFLFENLGISSFEIMLNGNVIKKHTVKGDFDNDVCYQAFDHFLRNTKKTREASLISPSRYKTDFTLFAFDLTNDYNNNYNLYEPTTGRLGVKVQFPTLYSSKVAIAFFVYTKSLLLDKTLTATVVDI